MTTTCGSGATTPPPARENAVPGPAAAAAGGRSASSLSPRIAPRTAFAAYLELLAQERRGSVAALGAATGRGASITASVSGAAAGGPDADANPACDARRADDGSEGDPSAPYAVPVGCDATIDPMVPILMSLQPLQPHAAPASAQVGLTASPQPDLRAPMEQLMAKLVRRIAWSGNARTGSARLELGAGELEGATLTIHADDGVVRVALDLPPGVDRAAWQERISGRLGARGLQVDTVEVS